MKPIFFKDKNELRKWFKKNHKTADEMRLGYYKVATGKPSVTWSESVDEALCVGWIDGVRNTIDEESYMIRFTKRKPTSIWSSINIAKVAELTKQGLMQPEGLEAFAKRKDSRSGIYSFENVPATLDAAYEKQFKANKKAWAYLNKIAAGYRKLAIHHVMDAKQEATRQRRLEKLITACEQEKKFWLLNQ